jgi:hypothetical protein
VYHGACQEPESAGIPSNRTALTLVHHRYVQVYATTLAPISEDDGAGEPGAEDCEAGGEVCESGDGDESGDEEDGDEDGDEAALPAADEAAWPTAPRYEPSPDAEDGEEDADFWLRGRCGTCGLDAADNTMKRCDRCGAMHHRACASQTPRPAAPAAWECQQCVNGVGAAAVLTISDPFLGTASVMTAALMLSQRGALSGAKLCEAAERDNDARKFVAGLASRTPGVWPATFHGAHCPLLFFGSGPPYRDTCGVRQVTFSTSTRTLCGKSTCSPPVPCATATRRRSRARSTRRGSTTPPRAGCTSACARWYRRCRRSCCSSRTWRTTSARLHLAS